MNIQNLASLPSDPDVTVLLVKKKIEQLQNSKGDDSENITNISLINVLYPNERSGKVNLLSSNTSSVCTSDCEHTSNGSPTLSHKMSSSHKAVHFSSACEQKSEESLIVIQTIQNIYAKTLTGTSENSSFEEVDLEKPSTTNLEKPILMSNKKNKNRSVLKRIFPCVFGKKVNYDE